MFVRINTIQCPAVRIGVYHFPVFGKILFINHQNYIIMKQNFYDVTRLASDYFPDSTARNARRRFLHLLTSEKDLWQRLNEMHFKPYQRSFTPRQYELIIDILGRPERYDNDFTLWDS